LKFHYAGPGGKTEVSVGGFVADGINKNGEYIEVQTSNFGSLKKKVKEYAGLGKVRIIHPIPVIKTIEVYDQEGVFLYKRKSSKKGSLWNIFDALLHAPELPLAKCAVIEVVLADIIEKRVKDGKGARRRKGISIRDKELAVWRETVCFTKRSDYLRFVPFKKGEEFTASLLAEREKINKITANKALYVLTKMKAVKRTGKKSRVWVYAR
jgi:hypothetical protein